MNDPDRQQTEGADATGAPSGDGKAGKAPKRARRVSPPDTGGGATPEGSAKKRSGGEKAAPARKGRRVGEKRARANEALRVELHALRAALATLIEGYEVRVGGRINDMIATIEGDPSIGQPPRLLPTAEAQAALSDIAGVRLRPDKPRLRDLRRIQRLVRRLRDRLPD